MTLRAAVPLALLLVACAPETASPPDAPPVPAADVAATERVLGLRFKPSERRLMAEDLDERRQAYATLRRHGLPDDVPPAVVFRPYEPPDGPQPEPTWSEVPPLPRPPDDAGLAWLSIGELGHLLRSGQVTSTELTKLALARLESRGVELKAVVTLTRDRALEQAAQADRELASGVDRGPLHGIPYGAKDLFAVAGYPTTWGAAPFEDQVLDETAAVIARLDKAGAVLVAKLSLGELASGDVWFGGQTRNPWKPSQGSHGSSAGSGVAVAAGMVPFALGTETWGSIVAPADRVGVIGLRPGFGRVSRHGAMTLAWSMDKVGALCRHAEDCAFVFDAIRGEDSRDPSSIGGGFDYEPAIALESLRIGYLEADLAADYPGAEQDRAFVKRLRRAGAQLVPVSLPDLPVGSMDFILAAEAATAFDYLTRSGTDDLLVRQSRDAWPNVLRAAQLVPAVEYLRANRLRTELVAAMEDLLREVDLYLAPSTHGPNLLLTNLTGHPAVVLPVGFRAPNQPTTISLNGPYLSEGRLLAVARQLQDRYGLGLNRPPGYE